MKCLFATIYLFCSITLAAQIGKIGITEFTLSNGLRVVLHEKHTMPLVSVSMAYHVGTKNDNFGEQGLAYFVQMMQTLGNKKEITEKYKNMIAYAGGKTSTNILLDYTLFHTTIPKNQLELALWIEAERMKHDSLNEPLFELQKRNFRHMHEEKNTYAYQQNHFYNYAYKRHPYKKGTLHIKNDFISSLNISTIDSFLRTYYQPHLATLCIVGDFNSFEVRKNLYQYFGHLKNDNLSFFQATQIKDPEWLQEVRDSISIESPEQLLGLAFHIPQSNTTDRPAIELLAQHFSCGKDAMLETIMHQKEPLAISIAHQIDETEDPSLFFLFTVIPKGVSFKETDKKISEELEKIQLNGLNEIDLNRAKTKLTTQLMTHTNSTAELCKQILSYKLFFNNADKINSYKDEYTKVTSEDIKRIANIYFNTTNRVVLYFIPQKRKQIF